MKKSFVFIILAIVSMASFASSTPKEIIARNGFKEKVDPLLTTFWSQDGGENCLLPTNGATLPVTGCGPIALAQILNFWKQPTKGKGDNFYVWYRVDPRRTIMHSDLSKSTYNWSNMLEVYKNNSNVTDAQLKEVGKLIYDIETVLEVNNGRGTQIEYIHTALKKYFGYNRNMQLMRQANNAYSDDEWLEMMYRELSEGRPIIVGGTASGGGNHVYVADGYDKNGKIHMNYGHGPYKGDTRYYDFSNKSDGYANDLRMIIGIQPETMEIPVTSLRVSTPGTLLNALGGHKNSRRVTRLKIIGEINDDDIKLLDSMAMTTNGQLSYLDISECKIPNNRLKNSAFAAPSCLTLQEIILPDNLETIGNNAFYNARGLYSLDLPRELKTIGRQALANCRYLSSLRLPANFNTYANDYSLGGLKLDTLIVDPSNEYLIVENGALLTKDRKTMLGLPVKRYGTFRIPDDVKVVCGNIDLNCALTKTIIFPASVEDVTWRFDSCFTAKNIYCHSFKAPQLHSTFSEGLEGMTLHVPIGCTDDYKEKGWDCFPYIVEDVDITPKDIILANGYAKQVDGMLRTTWAKDDGALAACFPGNTSAVLRPSSGAVAMAQVLKYFQTTDNGFGKQAFAYPLSSREHVNFSTLFQKKTWKWDNMLNDYSNKNANDEDEAAKLVYQCAVATFNKQQPKNGDHASQLQYCSTALKKFYGYNKNMRILNAKFYNYTEWLDIIYKQLSDNKPVLMECCDSSNDLVIVIDGYNSDGDFHVVGMGKNVFLAPKNINVFSDNTRMLVDVVPYEMKDDVKYVNVDTPGSLDGILGDERAKITSLVVDGSIDDNDLAVLKEMAQMEYGQLFKLVILADMPGNEVKGYAFQKCDMLQYVSLPQNTKKIGRHSFSYCYNLMQVEGLNFVTTIDNYSFFFCRYLDNVDFSGITSMGVNPLAYNKLSNLNVNKDYFLLDNYCVFDKGKTSIFSSMGSLEGDYVVPDNITTIKSMALRGCDNINKVWLPASVVSVGTYAFYECYNISDVYCYALNAPQISSSENEYAFYPECYHATLHIPKGRMEAYMQNGWDKFATIKDDLPATTLVIGDVNDDGDTSVVDVMLLVDKILGMNLLQYNPYTADVNKDGATDVVDVMTIVGIVLKKNLE